MERSIEREVWQVRFSGPIITAGAIALTFTSGCGYLPSEMSSAKKTAGHARVVAKQHTVSCTTPARGFRTVKFDDLFTATRDTRQPFREVDDTPAQYDVSAYVWGSDDCARVGRCDSGDRYWLIGRGPGADLTTWVVTPQFPRITIQSRCKRHLKVGRRYRFSFSRGKLVGFSR